MGKGGKSCGGYHERRPYDRGENFITGEAYQTVKGGVCSELGQRVSHTLRGNRVQYKEGLTSFIH